MVHSKLSIIFILIASAIAPVVAPPPPVTSHDVHSAPSSHSTPPSHPSHPDRQVKPLPKRSPAVQAQGDKGKAREVHLGSPNNPSIPGSSNNPISVSSSSSPSSQHSSDVHTPHSDLNLQSWKPSREEKGKARALDHVDLTVGSPSNPSKVGHSAPPSTLPSHPSHHAGAHQSQTDNRGEGSSKGPGTYWDSKPPPALALPNEPVNNR